MSISHHGTKPLINSHHFCSHSEDQAHRSDRFGRLFHQLPPLYTDPQVLNHLGRLGGPMDGGEKIKTTKTIDVGQVFFGQFLDHDITLDTSSSLDRVNNPAQTPNVRTPILDLDCIYGGGPESSPYLYHQKGGFSGVKLLTGADVNVKNKCIANDLVRSIHETAIIGDPRNDENRLLSQLQLAMIRFHNEVVHILSEKVSGKDLFEQARATVTHHYHWAVLYDFLPSMCGNYVVWDILENGRQFYCPESIAQAFIPIEFSVAAYRFGHSMVPQKIQVQKGGDMHFLFHSPSTPSPLGEGFTPLLSEDAIVDFHELFSTSKQSCIQKADKLDTKLAPLLLNLPHVKTGETSLATRNLHRGQSFLLPSGEVLARHLSQNEGITNINQDSIDRVSEFANKQSGGKLGGKTPLWFYLLAEAEVIGRQASEDQFHKGEGLGPVGARIVAEVIIGLMELDPHSFLSSNRRWQPADGVGDDVKTVGDILTYASSGTGGGHAKSSRPSRAGKSKSPA